MQNPLKSDQFRREFGQVAQIRGGSPNEIISMTRGKTHVLIEQSGSGWGGGGLAVRGGLQPVAAIEDTGAATPVAGESAMEADRRRLRAELLRRAARLRRATGQA